MSKNPITPTHSHLEQALADCAVGNYAQAWQAIELAQQITPVDAPNYLRVCDVALYIASQLKRYDWASEVAEHLRYELLKRGLAWRNYQPQFSFELLLCHYALDYQHSLLDELSTRAAWHLVRTLSPWFSPLHEHHPTLGQVLSQMIEAGRVTD